MTVLFTRYWDVIHGKFDEYSEFVTNQYNPTLEKLGIKLVGGFYVAVGQGPRIVAVATVEEQDYLRKILATEEYRLISGKLMSLVCEYYERGCGYPPVDSWKSPTEFTRERGNSISITTWFGTGRGALPLRQRRMHSRNERIAGAHHRSVAIGDRQGPHDSRRMHCQEYRGHRQGYRHAPIQAIGPDNEEKLRLGLQQPYLAPTGRIEIPYLMKEMMKGF